VSLSDLKLGHCDVPLKGPLPLLLFASWMPWGKLYPLPCTSYCLTIGPKAAGPNNHGLKCLKLWAQICSSSSEVNYLRYFLTVRETYYQSKLDVRARPLVIHKPLTRPLLLRYHSISWYHHHRTKLTAHRLPLGSKPHPHHRANVKLLWHFPFLI
jgi:hypothetical protein